MNLNLKISSLRVGRFAIGKMANITSLILRALQSKELKLRNKEDTLIVRRDGEYLSDALNISELEKIKRRGKAILLVELNEFHGASLVCNGISFEKLGFDVYYLVVWGPMIFDNPFFSLEKKDNIYTGTLNDIQNFLSKTELIKRNFDFIFYNTSFDWRGKSIFELLGRVPVGKFGFLMVEHNPIPNIKKLHEEFYRKKGMILHLSGFQGLPLLANTDNGLEKRKQKNKKIIRFAIVGAMSKKNRNFEQLARAMRRLIGEGTVNFFVHVVGPGNGCLPPDISPFVRFHGRLDYPSLYQVVRRSDYLLTLMDFSVEEHHKYIDNWSTGTSHLSYTTMTPVLIQRPFASSFGFNESNSLVYEVDSEKDQINLYKAMKTAIELNADDYEKMLLSLRQLTEELEERTQRELLKLIKRLSAEWE